MVVTAAQAPNDDEHDAPAAVDGSPQTNHAAWALAALVICGCVATAWTWRNGLGDAVLSALVPLRAISGAHAGAIGPSGVLAPLKAISAADAAGQTNNTGSTDNDRGWVVKHDGYVPINGGILTAPDTFEPTSGEYDLVIHFHGDVGIVRASFEHAGLNAALAIVNWGINSGAYRTPYQSGGEFEKLLAQINRGMIARGMAKPKLRRLALTSWSAGYGAIESILDNRVSPTPDADPLDAIIALDGVHAGIDAADPSGLKTRTVTTFLNAARAAVEGQIMLSMTHSDITPVEYAGTKRSQAYILRQLGIELHTGAMLLLPPQLRLPAAAKAVAEPKTMIPTSDTRKGMLRVRGFEGDTKAHHAAHLTQMAAVALPDLVARWR